ncbi:unnamed protein product, partial [Amoebophrya sp. A25]|eukprot:GSA25T00005948001.1
MSTFDERKSKILAAIDKSPKGSFDAPILDLLNYINGLKHYCTTSSCSGRIAVFKHNRRTETETERHRRAENHAGSDTDVVADGETTSDKLRQTVSSPEDGENLSDPVAELVTQHRTSANNADKGGNWVFVDHEPDKLGNTEKVTAKILENLEHLDEDDHVDFLFESFVLHVEARDLQCGQKLLSLALQTGYRESGLCVSTKNRCMVQIRT